MEEEAKRNDHPGWTNQTTCTFLDYVHLAFTVCLWESGPGELLTWTSHGNPVLHDLGNLSTCSVPAFPSEYVTGSSPPFGPQNQLYNFWGPMQNENARIPVQNY